VRRVLPATTVVIFACLAAGQGPATGSSAGCRASWHVFQPVPGGALFGVAAVAPDDAWTVGSLDGKALIEHWDGARWSGAAAPSVEGALHGVAAISRTDVWATGYSRTTC
jgi:hypothetical protein